MSIISARNHESKRWKRDKEKQKKPKDKKEQGETEAIVKGWKLNDFVEHLS